MKSEQRPSVLAMQSTRRLRRTLCQLCSALTKTETLGSVYRKELGEGTTAGGREATKPDDSDQRRSEADAFERTNNSGLCAFKWSYQKCTLRSEKCFCGQFPDEFTVQCESNRRLLYKVWSKSKDVFKGVVYSGLSCWFMMMNTKFSTFNQNVHVSIIMHRFKTPRRSQVSKSRKQKNVWIQKLGLKLKPPGFVSFA